MALAAVGSAAPLATAGDLFRLEAKLVRGQALPESWGCPCGEARASFIRHTGASSFRLVPSGGGPS